MRDATGRFLEGNPGGPGRPPRVTEAAYLECMANVVTLEAWESIVMKAVEDAKAGDDRARVWLGKHLLPRNRSPIAGLDDGADLDKVGQRLANLRLFRAIAGDDTASQRDRILAARELGKLLGLTRTEDEMDMTGVGERLFSLMRKYAVEEAMPPAPKLLADEAPEASHATG